MDEDRIASEQRVMNCLSARKEEKREVRKREVI